MRRNEVLNQPILLIAIVLCKHLYVCFWQSMGRNEVFGVLRSKRAVNLLFTHLLGLRNLCLCRLPVSHASFIIEPANVGETAFRISGSNHVLGNGLSLLHTFLSHLLDLAGLLLALSHELCLLPSGSLFGECVALSLESRELRLLYTERLVLVRCLRCGCIRGRSRRIGLLRTCWRVSCDWRGLRCSRLFLWLGGPGDRPVEPPTGR